MENESPSSDHLRLEDGSQPFQAGLKSLAAKEFSQSYNHFRNAETVFAQNENHSGQVQALIYLGEVSRNLNQYHQTILHWKQALAVINNSPDEKVKGEISLKLGYLYLKLGEYTLARDEMEQANRLFRNENYQHGICSATAYLGLLHHQIDDDETALEYTRLALRTTQEIGDRSTHADALTFQGHALVRLGLLDGAHGAYQYALNLCEELEDLNRKIDVQAGMARLMIANGSTHRAVAIMEELLLSLQGEAMEEVIEPVRVMLTCYTILSLTQDIRAKHFLTKAYNWLISKAGKIEDAGLQRSFLENIAAHRILLQIWMDKHFGQ